MGKTRNNSLRMQQAVRSIFEDYRQKQGCLGHVYGEAACGCDNALQMWRGPKGDKGDKGDTGEQGPPGQNAGSFLVSATFVVDPQGQEPGSYLELVLRDENQQLQTVYVDLSELEDVYTGGNGIDITSMVVAAKLGAGLTFDNQGNITSAYQFCDGLDETSNVVTVKLDSSNNILGFAGSGCKGLTATVSLAQAASGVALVLKGANNAVLSTIPLTGGTGITIQKDASGFTWLVDPSDLVSSTAGNNITISGNKLYVGDSALTYTTNENGGVFTLTNADGNTSTFTLPTTLQMLSRADMVCEGENAPYLRLTFKRDNGQNLYQDIDMSCLATAEMSLDVSCDEVTPERESFVQWHQLDILYSGGTSSTVSGSNTDTLTITVSQAGYAGIRLASRVAPGADASNHYVLSAPGTFEDLIANSPVLMTEDSCNAELSGISCGLKVWLSCTSNGNNSYTFTFETGDEPAVELTADLVSGENRVDLKPLLEHIGGHIENCSIGEDVLIPFAGEDLPATGTFAGLDLSAYADLQDCCNGTPNTISYDGDLNADGSVTFCFASEPSYFLIEVYLAVDGEPDESFYYGHDVCTASACSLDTALAGGITLQQFDVSTGDPTGNTLLLRCVAESNHCYTFYLYDAEIKPMLKLEPSCNTCIDLSPLLSDFEDRFVHIEGAETINGVKTFNAGYFGNVEALTEDQNNPGEYPVDVSHATAFTLTLDDDAEFVFSGVPANRSACFSLKLDNGGDYTVTWPINVYWCNDTEPELTSSGTDILTFMTFDGGQTWYGTLSMMGITLNQLVV